MGQNFGEGNRGWKVTDGGGTGPEEFIPGPGGGKFASGKPDITAEKMIGGRLRRLRINTVTVDSTGKPISTELDQALRIRIFGAVKDGTGTAHLLLVPKG